MTGEALFREILYLSTSQSLVTLVRVQSVYKQGSLPTYFLIKHKHSKELAHYDGHKTFKFQLTAVEDKKVRKLARSAPLNPQAWSQGGHLYPSHWRLSLRPPARTQLRLLCFKDLIFRTLTSHAVLGNISEAKPGKDSVQR